MALFRIDHRHEHHHHNNEHRNADNVEHRRRVEQLLGTILEGMEDMALNTQAALDAVRQLTTDSASQRELLKQIKTSLDQVKADLAAAIAAGDPAAIAAAQQDLDNITTLANTEDASVKDAITANTPTATT